jgi:serine protease Do
MTNQASLFSAIVAAMFVLAGRAHGVSPGGTNAPPPSRPAPEHATSADPIVRAFRPVTEHAHVSVVRLETGDSPVALGAIVRANGLVVTKASEVVSRALTCRLADGKRVPARLLISDDETDLALIQIEADHLTPIIWDTGDIHIGEWAITPGTGRDPSGIGIVSATPRRIQAKRAMIGIQLDLRNSASARIERILPGMGAEKAGLLPGDVILTVNDVLVPNREALIDTLQSYREGDSVRLRVRRDDSEFEKDILLQFPDAKATGQRVSRQERMNHFGGELSRRAEGFEMAIQHDTVLQPDECGGPLVNLEGKAIGLNIARAGRIASYALPAPLVVHTVELLEQTLDLPPAKKDSQFTGRSAKKG